LQPFELLVVSNPEVRARIRAVSHDQSQITDGSHLLVFAAWDTYSPERINHMFDLNVNMRGGTNDGWENYRHMLLNNYPLRDPQINFEHAARQAYIAMGFSLIAAAAEQVDSTPMEGFDPKALDQILKLSERGLRSVAIMPLGYREADKDWLVNLPKVRRPFAEFVTEIK
jgi:nitroreductase